MFHRSGGRNRLLYRFRFFLHSRFGGANLAHGFSGTLAFLYLSQDIIYIVTFAHDNLRAQLMSNFVTTPESRLWFA
jgi:hypothetical protein